MAGQGRKTFSDGEVLSAADVNGYLMDQSVMRFADSTARDAAIGTATEGMIAYLDDTNEVLKYDGSSWIDIIETADVITTEGDLIIGNASGDPVRLPVGLADQVLTSNGTTVSFQDPGGGGGGMTLLSEVDLTGSSSVTVSSIPQIYKDLRIEVIEFSCDTANRSISFQLRGAGSDAQDVRNGRIENNTIYTLSSSTSVFIQMPVGLLADGDTGTYVFTVSNYAETEEKSFFGVGQSNYGPAAAQNFGGVSETDPIEEVVINISGTFQSGTVRVYGVI